MKKKILIIEDELALLQTLKLNLELEGYEVETASNGKDGLLIVKSSLPNLLLLDIMMPELSGTDIFKEMKRLDLTIPTIFLTAKNNVHDKIDGLKLGAEDYITKPFDLEELLLRIKIVLKRNLTQAIDNESYTFNNCEINFLTYQIISIKKHTETLSKREIALLKLLIEDKNHVVSRDIILEKLWTQDENPSSRTIDNYILNFRKLFEKNPKKPIHFLSVRSVGYKFCI